MLQLHSYTVSCYLKNTHDFSDLNQNESLIVLINSPIMTVSVTYLWYFFDSIGFNKGYLEVNLTISDSRLIIPSRFQLSDITIVGTRQDGSTRH